MVVAERMPGQLAKGLKKIIFGHLFFSFSFDQKLWWIPHVTCRMSFLFFWPRTHNVCYICLALLSFLFSKSRICPCLVLSFLLFHSHLFPSAFGGFWIWLQTREPVLSWMMYSSYCYIILRSLIVFPC